MCLNKKKEHNFMEKIKLVYLIKTVKSQIRNKFAYLLTEYKILNLGHNIHKKFIL